MSTTTEITNIIKSLLENHYCRITFDNGMKVVLAVLLLSLAALSRAKPTRETIANIQESDRGWCSGSLCPEGTFCCTNCLLCPFWCTATEAECPYRSALSLIGLAGMKQD